MWLNWITNSALSSLISCFEMVCGVPRENPEWTSELPFSFGCLWNGLNWIVCVVGKTNRTPWVGWTLRLWASHVYIQLLGLLIYQCFISYFWCWKSCCGLCSADCMIKCYSLFAVCFRIVWLNFQTLLWLSAHFFLLQSGKLSMKKWQPRYTKPINHRHVQNL